MVSGIKAVIGVSGKACVSERILYVAQTGSKSTFASPMVSGDSPYWKEVKKILKPTFDEKKDSFFLQRNDIGTVSSIESIEKNYLPAIEVGDWRNS